MRLTLMILGAFLAVLGFQLPRTQASVPAMTPVQESMTHDLFQGVQLAMIKNDAAACGTLSPLPLFTSSPSLDDWQTFCLAMVEKHPSDCTRITATLQPDLRVMCESAFPRSSL